MTSRSWARIAVYLFLAAVFAMVGVGLRDVADKHSIWWALAIVPGIPVAGLMVIWLLSVAFGPDERQG